MADSSVRRCIEQATSVGLLVVAVGCQRGPTYDEVRGEGLGTSWVVKWATTDGVDREDVAQAAFDALQAVDKGMSTWRDDSEIAIARRSDGPVQVSEPTWKTVHDALDLAATTHGAFDPTVQPLVELWGFHGTPRTTWPTNEEIDAALALVDWEKVEILRKKDGTAWIDTHGTALDLSAIAKGYAVDRVALSLSSLGITDHMVEVGGEVRAHGRGPAGGPWRIGIERPDTELRDDAVAELMLSNAAVATSGNYRAKYMIDGEPVHHTLDARTGRPAEVHVLSASVIAPDCRTADSWATALMVLGPAEGLRLIGQRPELEAWMVIDGPDGPHVESSVGAPAIVTSLLPPS